MQPAASSWSFEEDDLNAIARTISRFLAETGVRSALLVDRAFSRARAGRTAQPNILAGAGDEIDELFNW